MLKAVRDNAYNALIGEQWIGLRVRASTHSIFGEAGDLASSSSSNDGRHYSYRRAASHVESTVGATKAMCTGTVVQYCGLTDQHFVVFDDEGLQPQWVVAEKGVMDILIGPDEALPASPAGELALRPEKGPRDCVLCGLAMLSENGTPLTSDFKSCSCCSLICHTYCAPSLILEPEDQAGWVCWNCNCKLLCIFCYQLTLF